MHYAILWSGAPFFHQKSWIDSFHKHVKLMRFTVTKMRDEDASEPHIS